MAKKKHSSQKLASSLTSNTHLFVPYDKESEIQWYDLEVFSNNNCISLPVASTEQSFTRGQIELMRAQGEKLIKLQEKIFSENIPSDLSFYYDILDKGTHSDRLAAYGLLVAKVPYFFISKLVDWMSWISSGMTRAESIIEAIVSLAQVFSNSILPTSRKLKFLEQHNESKIPPDLQLWVWSIEDAFKRAYADLLRLFEIHLASPYEHLRLRLIPTVATLLSAHPEQELALLSLLLGRLGDSSKKVAASSGRAILGVIVQHPAMTEVMISNIWQQVLGPKSSSTSKISQTSLYHSKYYGITLMTQIPLDARFKELASKMITIYVSLIEEFLSDDVPFICNDKSSTTMEKFKKYPHTKKTNQGLHSNSEKLISLILKGLYRSFVICKDSNLPSIDILFRLTHTGAWPKSLQALWLLLKVVKGVPSLEDRFQRALWESLIDIRSVKQGRIQAEQHITLIKAFLLDKISSTSSSFFPICIAFSKRWLGYVINESAPIICAVLQVILEVFLALDHKKINLKGITSLPGDSNISWNPIKRDPLWSGIIDSSTLKVSTSFFEICPFLEHYHPSVVILAKAILVSTGNFFGKTTDIEPNTILKNSTPSPLETFSTSSFLNRWAYKNPKKSTFKSSENSLMPSSTKFSLAIESNIDESDKFFHKYFVNKPKRLTLKSGIPDAESDSDLEFDSNVLNDEQLDCDDDLSIDDMSNSSFESMESDIGSEEEAILDYNSEESEGKLDKMEVIEENETEFLLGNVKNSTTKSKKKLKLPLLASAEDYEQFLN